MNVERNVQILLCEQTIDDLSIQTYVLQSQLSLLEERQRKMILKRKEGKSPIHLWVYNQTIKTLAVKIGRAQANLAVLINNRAFFQSRLQKILEGTHE